MFEEKKIEHNFNLHNNNDDNNLQNTSKISQNNEKNEKYDKIMLDSMMISSYNLTKGKNFLDTIGNVTNFEKSLESEYKILNFTNKTKDNTSNRQNISEYIQGLKRLTDADNLLPKLKKDSNERIIPPTPERILDAPNLIDDYYLNLLDWSVDNVVSIGLGIIFYLIHIFFKF